MKKVKPLPVLQQQKNLLSPRTGLLIALIITVAYSLVAFNNFGTSKVPKTWFTAMQAGEQFFVDMGSVRQPDRLYLYTGVGEGLYQVDISKDGQTWAPLVKAKRQTPFIWSWSVFRHLHSSGGRYLRWTVERPGEMLMEIAIAEAGSANSISKLFVSRTLPFDGTIDKKLARLIDEQDTFTEWPDNQTGMVFDEVYHARTAWEQLGHREPYEWTHPPLGKIIISASIAIFGMNPVGWRVPGILFGILMLPLIYYMARKLFGDPLWGVVAIILFAVDFMHFTQSRLGTVDVFLVFFIMGMFASLYGWYQNVGQVISIRRDMGWLLLSGICMGLAVATKWNALYAAGGLAILWCVAFFSRLQNYTGLLRAKWIISTLGISVIAFIVMPLIIYYVSYIPYFQVPGHSGGIKEVVDYQVRMYAYHSELNATHDFASPWWQWPLMIKPVWYYSGRGGVPDGVTSSIAAFGNPLIWWLSIPVFAMSVFITIRKRSRIGLFLVVAFAAQYLPWIIAPRKVTFIYHYFPAVPFAILMIIWVMKNWMETRLAERSSIIVLKRSYAIYLGLSILAFAMFYPVLSGAWVPDWYANSLKWLPGWFF